MLNNREGECDEPKTIKGSGCVPIIATIFITLILMFLVVWHSPAKAQGFAIKVILQCNTTDVILGMLHGKYRELPTGGGMSKGEHVRLFESHDAGDKQTWTLVISNPNGLSCIMKGGEDWITNPVIPEGNPL